ncbi:MAG: glycosyltransferase [Firmicutes bacterium]|nr:glycosyltransferase [Bacillota bacterium]
MNEPALIIFSRIPLPGRTKSRLREVLTAEEAALFHRACLVDLFDLVRGIGYKTYLYITGGGEEEFREAFSFPMPEGFQALRELDLNGLRFKEQLGADLGERMHNAISGVLREHDTAVLLGSDIPGVNESIIRSASRMLERHDLVIGPASDGGYYLIGMKKPWPGVFANIPWGSGEVLRQTLKSADAEGLKCFLLPTRPDIDEWEDLVSVMQMPEAREKKLAAYRFGNYLVNKYSENHKGDD